jgi:hypothetical protein
MRVRTGRLRLRDESGATLAFVAVSIVALVGMVALTADFGAMFAKRRGMVTAADAASLAFAESCALDEGQSEADDQSDALAEANQPNALRDGPEVWPVDGDCDGTGSVTVTYQDTQELFFAPMLGLSGSQAVKARASAAWGPTSGVGSVLPVMLSMGRLSTCDIPNEEPGEDCWFYLDNSELGNAQWSLLNVQPDCNAQKFGWNVSVAHCDARVNPPEPTYNCPAFSTDDMVDLIEQGSPPLEMDPDGVTYVCNSSGAHTPAFRAIEDLEDEDEIRMFPVNDPDQQVENGGDPVPEGEAPDFYAIVGFIEMRIVDVYRGTDQDWDLVNCPGQKNSNAWCLHAEWIGYTLEPGAICEECTDFGPRAVNLTG